MSDTELNQNTNGIKLASAQAAAKYWAGFLPPVKSWLGLVIRGVDYMRGYDHSFPSITQKQYDIFVEALTNEILNLSSPRWRHKEYVEIDIHYHDGCLDLGSYRDLITGRSFENAPDIVLNAIKAAGIKEEDKFPLYTFPSKICMQIYNIGHVRVKTKYSEEMIYTSPDIIHYTKINDLNFNHAVHVKIKGHDFRIIEIKLSDLSDNLLYRIGFGFDWDNFEDILPKAISKIIAEADVSMKYFNKSKAEIIDEVLFTRISVEDIKGSYTALRNLTNQDFTAIFQDSIKLTEIIDNQSYISFEKEVNDCLRNDQSYNFIGSVSTESLGENYYQYSTAPVWIIKIPEICKERLCTVMADYELYTIKPDDMLFKLDNSDEVHIFPASLQARFSLYLCENSECNITADQPIYSSMSGEL